MRTVLADLFSDRRVRSHSWMNDAQAGWILSAAGPVKGQGSHTQTLPLRCIRAPYCEQAMPLTRVSAGQRLDVGVAGFEPAAPRSQSECATKLRHTP
jgi:hypothetical protein